MANSHASIERFTTRAAAYAASRPSYPSASIDALFAGLGDPETLAVADLGAGTGISSRPIAERGARVYAIEPNAAMRAAATAAPRIEWIDGTAERTTLAAASIDIVAAFQAWHWVEREAALREARRIARPGGRLVIAYNERDEAYPFTAGYGDVVRRYATDTTERRRAEALAGALRIEPARTTRHEARHCERLARAVLHGRANSSSYLPERGSAAAAAMHAEIDALVDRFERNGTVEMHLVTFVVRIEL